MEWLINRRRMMYNRTKPIAYLDFDDYRAWQIFCYNYGDVKKVINEEIAHGNITCDGTDLISSEYMYASCVNLPARQLSNGTTQARVRAASQNFNVEITFDSSSPFTDVSGTVIQVSQSDGTATKTAILTVAKDDVVLDGNNKYVGTFQATSTCNYLIVSVNANDGVVASWKILPITGNYQPVGITQAQCNVVTSITSPIFRSNILVVDLRCLTYFPTTSTPNFLCDQCYNLEYITFPSTLVTMGTYQCRQTKLTNLVIPNSVTTIGTSSFIGITTLVSVTLGSGLTTMPSFTGCSNLESDIIIPPLVTTTPTQVIAATKVSKIVFHENITSIGTYSFQYMESDHLDVYVYATTPPTLGNGSFNGTSSYTIYVPASAVDTYKETGNWAGYASHIEAIVEE